ncbi:hypothetical protein AVEN_101635-1 [Araneus ventricosus]|uniref:Uncharacterized protein n=1 Tax=Araneus ventricosus TaxID=182803 RepID=A0A4Y2EZ65_ARAVE|nr:hypothetical protein AVEN_101635-1 [Araneus ventricosus]
MFEVIDARTTPAHHIFYEPSRRRTFFKKCPACLFGKHGREPLWKVGPTLNAGTESPESNNPYSSMRDMSYEMIQVDSFRCFVAFGTQGCRRLATVADLLANVRNRETS